MIARRLLVWSMAGVLVLTTFGMLPVAPAHWVQATPPAVDAKIEIVWPHDRQGNPAPVATAPLVNVEVYLFERGTLNPVACGFPNKV